MKYSVILSEVDQLRLLLKDLVEFDESIALDSAKVYSNGNVNIPKKMREKMESKNYVAMMDDAGCIMLIPDYIVLTAYNNK